jgi:bestrophin-3
VVTLATYSFLIASIFGRQFIGKGEDEISVDIFFPTWAVLENLFYLGLLKV